MGRGLQPDLNVKDVGCRGPSVPFANLRQCRHGINMNAILEGTDILVEEQLAESNKKHK
jgi:hypothetical protein